MIRIGFERPDLNALLEKRLSGFVAGYRQNVALIGPEGIGKTTLLQRFLQGQASARASSLICIYLEVVEADHLEEWASRSVQAILYGFSRSRRSENPPMKLSELLQRCAEEVPRTVALARRALQGAEAGRADEAYGQLWDLPQLLSQEAGLRVLLALDEFHRLRCLPVRDPFRAVGRRIMVQSGTMYLAASSQPAVARSILREGLALLFGQFETLEVGPLGSESCRRALRSVWPAVQADPFAEHLVLELAQGRPDRFHLMLQVLEQTHAVDAPADAETAIPALLEALFLQPVLGLRQQFEAQIRSLPAGRGRLLCLQVLEAAASGLHRPREMAGATGRSASQVLRALKALEQGRVLTHRGPFYWIPDRLLGLWLITAYPILSGFGWTEEEQIREHHRQAVLSWMSRHRDAYGQTMESRVLELLRRWEGERVEIDGRQVILPAFRRIEPAADRGSHPGWEAHRSGKGRSSRWLVQIWRGPLGEPDARALVQGFRGDPGCRGHRKLLLGADPVEVNARLVLQEGRIRLWDFHVVNDLLGLYGLPELPASSEAKPATETVSIPPAGREEEEEGPLSASSGMSA